MKRDYLKTDFHGKIVGRKDSIKPKLPRKVRKTAVKPSKNIPGEQYTSAELQTFMTNFDSLCNKYS